MSAGRHPAAAHTWGHTATAHGGAQGLSSGGPTAADGFLEDSFAEAGFEDLLDAFAAGSAGASSTSLSTDLDGLAGSWQEAGVSPSSSAEGHPAQQKGTHAPSSNGSDGDSNSTAGSVGCSDDEAEEDVSEAVEDGAASDSGDSSHGTTSDSADDSSSSSSNDQAAGAAAVPGLLAEEEGLLVAEVQRGQGACQQHLAAAAAALAGGSSGSGSGSAPAHAGQAAGAAGPTAGQLVCSVAHIKQAARAWMPGEC
jgi:hypothetical protein